MYERLRHHRERKKEIERWREANRERKRGRKRAGERGQMLRKREGANAFSCLRPVRGPGPGRARLGGKELHG